MPLADLLAERDGAFGAAADSTLLARLDLKLGDRITVGNAPGSRSAASSSPNRTSSPAMSASARACAGQRSEPARHRPAAARQPGALDLPAQTAGQCRRRARRLPSSIESARGALPEAGWEIRSRANASPQLERSINRFTQFLTLVGLAALLVGGVGVANAVKSHIDRRRDVIAAFKALGATGRDVFAIYLTQVVVLADDRLGDRARRSARRCRSLSSALFGKLLPLPVIPALHADELASVLHLWPAHRAGLRAVAARPGARRAGRGAVPRGGRDREWHRPRWGYLALMAAVIALLVTVAIGLAYDKRVASRSRSWLPRSRCSRCCAASPLD